MTDAAEKPATVYRFVISRTQHYRDVVEASDPGEVTREANTMIASGALVAHRHDESVSVEEAFYVTDEDEPQE